MKTHPESFPLAGLWLAALLVLPPTVGQAQAVFTLDPSQSQITFSGTLSASGYGTAPIIEQSPGSLTAAYAGTILLTSSNGAVQFTGSSQILAQNYSSDLQPDVGGASGSAPADYGGVAQANLGFGISVTLYLALRNVALDVTSPLEPVTGGAFDASGLLFSFPASPAGSLDYLDNLGDSGTESLTGDLPDSSTAPATLVIAGHQQVLTIPVVADYTQASGYLVGTTLHLAGQLVAARPLPVIGSITRAGGVVMVEVQNLTSPQAWVQFSADLKTWSIVTPTLVTAPAPGTLVYTLPSAGTAGYLRVEE